FLGRPPLRESRLSEYLRFARVPQDGQREPPTKGRRNRLCLLTPRRATGGADRRCRKFTHRAFGKPGRLRPSRPCVPGIACSNRGHTKSLLSDIEYPG